MEIIIRGNAKFGRTRSEQEENLRKEGMRSLSDEQLDKCKFIERKIRDSCGSKENVVGQHVIGGDSGIKTGS
jgi:hypothetical protein